MRKISAMLTSALLRSSRAFYAAVFFAALLLAAGSISILNSQTGGGPSPMSRTMEQAMRLYQEGEDNEAMDRFMNILVKGTPSEKAIANDYISRITNRISSVASSIPGAPPADEERAIVGQQKPAPAPKQSKPEEASAAPAASEEDAEDQRQAVSRRISQKISAMRAGLLKRFNSVEAVKIYMAAPMPRAISLDPKYFFSSDTVFKAEAGPALADLAGLVFTLGKAAVTIIPEGTLEEDVKIKAIRQAIALNSYLVSRGLSQSRISVNLIKSDMKFPSELGNPGGLILLLDYDKEPKLSEPEGARSEAPRVSLGIYPTSLSTDSGDGSIVEFSVFKPLSGDVSWRLEVFALRPDSALSPLQKVEDVGPLCRQTFWNGRKNLAGEAYPPGKYMFSITASDEQGRESNLRRFLVINPSAAEVRTSSAPAKALGRQLAGAPAAKAKAARAAARKKTARKARPAGVPAKAAAKASIRKPAAAESALDGPGADEQRTSDDGTEKTHSESGLTYKIGFEEGTATVTEDGEKRLGKIAETLSYYPMAQIKLIGYAHSGEGDPQTLARRRVDLVSARLSDKYNIGSDRMESSVQVTGDRKNMVEIKMRGNN